MLSDTARKSAMPRSECKQRHGRIHATPRLTLSTTLTDRSGQPPLPDTVLSILRQKQSRLKAAPAEEDIPSMEAELVVLQKQTFELRGQLDAAMAQMQSLRESAGTKGNRQRARQRSWQPSDPPRQRRPSVHCPRKHRRANGTGVIRVC